ncbi:MAG: D-alanyl-D-alanine carboxypeptidase [Moraxellaceae bacterium]|jgi:D-alanyl-D-alanine carboxypeptidase (penicillin-binding protein 5/6)|nr:D-alanyl-D-alanine carboxypeptidase [Moraxellaceae bacterium]MDF3030274.1 D-alanyl-D-alanine carboxypeptidase [Moraxellaceae bacterium]
MRRFFLAGLAPLLLAATVHAAPPPPPELDNRAYLLVDYDSGRVLAEKNSHERLPPASLTKMMTSYIVEQALATGRIKENDQVFVSEHAWCRGTSTESCMYLPLNSRASVIDMLRGVIIQSGNDASKALAEHIGGSEPAFAEVMNQQAARLGMKDSHFRNATGLPDPQHLTSAYDMAILARAIIRDSAHYYPIYAEKEFTFNGIKQGNRNALLYTDPTVDGLKTGHTEEAGYCLVSSSKRGGMRLIAVVMGTKSMQERADQSRALYSWGFANFENVKPYAAGTVLGTPKVWFGKAESVKVGLASDVNLTLAHGDRNRLQAAMQIAPTVNAPLTKGQQVGTLTLTLDGQVVASQPIVAMEPVEEAGFFTRLWHRIKLFFMNLL